MRWVAFPLIETFVLTCRFLPTTTPPGAIRPLGWTVRWNIAPPTVGVVNPEGCVSITEVCPEFMPLAVNVTVVLLTPPVNESKVDDTVPTLGIELAMGTLRAEPGTT